MKLHEAKVSRNVNVIDVISYPHSPKGYLAYCHGKPYEGKSVAEREVKQRREALAQKIAAGIKNKMQPG